MRRAQVVGDMIRYPNQMSFDIMEGGGAMPPPQGMLVIKVVGIPKLHGAGHWWDKVGRCSQAPCPQGWALVQRAGSPDPDLLSRPGCSGPGCCAQVDPYIVVSIKENRKQRTRTLSNNNKPTWNETITTIVNDPDAQSITFKLMDDDVGSFDSVRSLSTPVEAGVRAARLGWPSSARVVQGCSAVGLLAASPGKGAGGGDDTLLPPFRTHLPLQRASQACSPPPRAARMQEVGTGELPLAGKAFFERPGEFHTVHVHLLQPEAADQLVQYAKVLPRQMRARLGTVQHAGVGSASTGWSFQRSQQVWGLRVGALPACLGNLLPHLVRRASISGSRLRIGGVWCEVPDQQASIGRLWPLAPATHLPCTAEDAGSLPWRKRLRWPNEEAGACMSRARLTAWAGAGGRRSAAEEEGGEGAAGERQACRCARQPGLAWFLVV